MKRFVYMLLILVCILTMLTACGPSSLDATDASSTTSSTDTTASTAPSNASETPSSSPASLSADLPKYVPGSIILDDRRYWYNFDRNYRLIYYRIQGEFFELLSEEEETECSDWLSKNSEETNYGEFRNEMLLVSFVKKFNISREEFDSAVEELRKHDEGLTQYEEYEIPNADIIYTFDNAIINEYYRYE